VTISAKIQRLWRSEIRWGLSRWSVAGVLLVLMLAIPTFVLLAGFFESPGPEWQRMKQDLVGGYVSHSLILAVGVAILSLAFGVSTAWVVASKQFPGRKIFASLLALPLAIPSYVAAYTYAEVRDGMIHPLIWIRKTWGIDAYMTAELASRYGLMIMVLAAVLYPYVYLAARASFALQGRQLIEASRTLGAGSRQTFFQVALPVSRPAIFGGVLLVVMEVLNDYGAVSFFGFSTLTVGIFRAWFSSGEHASAVRLAGWLLIGIIVMIGLERALRGRRRFHDAAQDSTHLARHKVGVAGALSAWLVCGIPLILGLIFPLQRLVRWSWMGAEKSWNSKLWGALGNSVLLAGGATLIIVVLAIILAFAGRLHRTRLMSFTSRLAMFGYAMPGAVIAVGVLVVFGWMDGRLSAATDGKTGLIFSGTLIAVGFAYAVRFLAVAFQPTEACLQRVCGEHDEAARTLGRSPLETLWSVNLPLMKMAIAAAAMLVFVDVLKELPLTLILRPFNFDTLATKSYSLASEGRLTECATPALIVVAVGAVAMGLLNRLVGENRK